MKRKLVSISPEFNRLFIHERNAMEVEVTKIENGYTASHWKLVTPEEGSKHVVIFCKDLGEVLGALGTIFNG